MAFDFKITIFDTRLGEFPKSGQLVTIYPSKFENCTAVISSNQKEWNIEEGYFSFKKAPFWSELIGFKVLEEVRLDDLKEMGNET